MQYISYIIIGALLLYGAISYKINHSLGAGDIKYLAILIAFLGAHSLSTFIGNIGVLTLVLLSVWYFIILGQLLGLREYIKKSHFQKNLRIDSSKAGIQKIILYIGDWIIIGFFIKNIFDIFSKELFQILPINGEVYFLISLITFLIRPSIRYILTKWQYKIFPIFLILIYFGFYIQEYGFMALMANLILFIQGMWIYFIVFTSIIFITGYTFHGYNNLMKSIGYTSRFDTIPYSVIIFLGFMLTYFFDINLLKLFKDIYLF